MLTFQRFYKITLGQFRTSDGIRVIQEITDLRFKANINVTARSSTVTTPAVSKVSIFNLAPETIAEITNAENLYIEIKAGYKYSGGIISEDPDELPVVYLGSIREMQTVNTGVDLVTSMQCVPMNNKTTSGKANRVFTKGAKVSEVFDYLGRTMNAAISHEWEDKSTLVLKQDKTLTGSSSVLMTQWAERYDLRAVNEKAIIKIIDKDVKTTKKSKHTIPLSNSKGYPSISFNLAKSLKEKTPLTADITVNTFLYPEIGLNETVQVELIDYASPQVLGEYESTFQEFVVSKYSHKLDSHNKSGQTWMTTISGKGT